MAPGERQGPSYLFRNLRDRGRQYTNENRKLKVKSVKIVGNRVTRNDRKHGGWTEC